MTQDHLVTTDREPALPTSGSRRNLHDLPTVTLEAGDVAKVLNNAARQGLESVDLVVLDPPLHIALSAEA